MNKKVVDRISEILEPTEAQKKRMFNSILEKYRNENTKKRLSPMKRFKLALVAAVMAVCLVTTTAFAAVYMGLDINFLNFLKPSSNEQKEYLANGAYVVDKQVANKSGTLDIKQVIGDGNLIYILMDFTAAEETPLNMSRYRFENIDFNADQNFYSYDWISLKDENTADNKISMIMSVYTKKSLMGQKVNLGLADLQGSASSTGTFDTMISGEWKTSFRLDFKEYSTDYQVNKEIKMFEYAATVKNISISPISIAIKIESPFLERITTASMVGMNIEEKQLLDRFPITINYKDGTSETTTNASGMYLAELGLGEMLNIKTFEENVINDKEITSITFFGTEVQISD